MSGTVKATVKRGYLVKMSVGFDLRIDADELPMIVTIWKSGDIGKFRQGIIKGSYIAGVIEDRERIVVEHDFNPGTGERYERVRLLADVFKGAEFKEKKLIQELNS